MRKIAEFITFLLIFVGVFLSANFASAQYYYNYNYNNCTYHAYRLCNGNNIYWYDSCENQQDLYQTCYGINMVCKYGQCVYQQPVQPVNPYVLHKTISCYNNNLYWFDSLGKTSGLYEDCADSNSCTFDSCTGRKCSNTIKCDGSTCATGSADYNIYCSQDNQNQNNQNTENNLSFSFFAKTDSSSTQWEKSVNSNSNSTVYFMISAVNNANVSVDNVNVLANIPQEITMLGNLQINGVATQGDIVSGINLGNLQPTSGKTITFEGKVGAISSALAGQAQATLNVSGATKQDSVSINFSPSQNTGASVSGTQTTSGFLAFLKRWYLWILVGLVLIFLFIVVFRRLSSNS